VARSGDTQGRQLNLLNKQIFLRSSPLRSMSRLCFAALEMTKEAHLLIRKRITIANTGRTDDENLVSEIEN